MCEVLLPCVSSVALYDLPFLDAHTVRQLPEKQVVVLLACQGIFAKIRLFSEDVQGWIVKPQFSVIFSPPRALQEKKQLVVQLFGACSAGKSSVEKAICTQDPSWVTIDEDDVLFDVFKKAISARFPKEYAAVASHIEERNLYHAFTRNQICFKEKTSPTDQLHVLSLISTVVEKLDCASELEWKKTYCKMINERVIELFRTALAANNNVVIFTWGRPVHSFLSSTNTVKNISVLLYNPLAFAFERLLERNRVAEEEKDYSLKRFPSFIPNSYCSHYKATSEQGHACEIISREEIENTFRSIGSIQERPRPAHLLNPFSEYDIPESVVQGGIAEFFSGIDAELRTCYVTPKKQYDIILRSDRSSPNELATALLKTLSQAD